MFEDKEIMIRKVSLIVVWDVYIDNIDLKILIFIYFIIYFFK